MGPLVVSNDTLIRHVGALDVRASTESLRTLLQPRLPLLRFYRWRWKASE